MPPLTRNDSLTIFSKCHGWSVDSSPGASTNLAMMLYVKSNNLDFISTLRGDPECPACSKKRCLAREQTSSGLMAKERRLPEEKKWTEDLASGEARAVGEGHVMDGAFLGGDNEGLPGSGSRETLLQWRFEEVKMSDQTNGGWAWRETIVMLFTTMSEGGAW
ncbi:hypothetical protein GW17_00037869 [Ensete ventricosum]|nr:hypothetical protein GW17_00037869 [Ensete ventricosum]